MVRHCWKVLMAEGWLDFLRQRRPKDHKSAKGVEEGRVGEGWKADMKDWSGGT